ncbi:hypothetical protein GUJ93_ZPchr0012g19038 [Zizania palustris]|uniref:Uncharacterized protein n=1 Tax=Zizania palustris TaxID=103762 RepID=A0A8J5WLY1_ZIZPA|nr:hypothetical protein GUJ93_ZPchr0012g19038 [Zizania palustris]
MRLRRSSGEVVDVDCAFAKRQRQLASSSSSPPRGSGDGGVDSRPVSRTPPYDHALLALSQCEAAATTRLLFVVSTSRQRWRGVDSRPVSRAPPYDHALLALSQCEAAATTRLLFVVSTSRQRWRGVDSRPVSRAPPYDHALLALSQIVYYSVKQQRQLASSSSSPPHGGGGGGWIPSWSRVLRCTATPYLRSISKQIHYADAVSVPICLKKFDGCPLWSLVSDQSRFLPTMSI